VTTFACGGKSANLVRGLRNFRHLARDAAEPRAGKALFDALLQKLARLDDPFRI